MDKGYGQFKKNLLARVEWRKSVPTAWRIKLNGEFVKMRSGRAIWATRGHAVNAFKNDVYSDWRDVDQETRDAWFKRIQDEGVLEFVNMAK